jgi:peptide-methionine (S)-S-oxide reductase
MKHAWMSIAILVMLSVQLALSQEKRDEASLAKATFAGGCFWCMEGPFDELEGVLSTTSGYIAGHKKNPTYEEVSAGTTGHTEAVQVVYDPTKIT